MSTVLESVIPDNKPLIIRPKSGANSERVVRDLGKFREEIAKRLKAILQDLFNQYDELQGIENRERRMAIYHDIRDHTKLYKDLVLALEITAEKNETRRDAKSQKGLMTGMGALHWSGTVDRFLNSLEIALKNWPVPMENETRSDLLRRIAEVFDSSFKSYSYNYMDDDE